jgi:hypothetical protein
MVNAMRTMTNVRVNFIYLASANLSLFVQEFRGYSYCRLTGRELNLVLLVR